MPLKSGESHREHKMVNQEGTQMDEPGRKHTQVNAEGNTN